jgi:hypothetical protein
MLLTLMDLPSGRVLMPSITAYFAGICSRHSTNQIAVSAVFTAHCKTSTSRSLVELVQTVVLTPQTIPAVFPLRHNSGDARSTLPLLQSMVPAEQQQVLSLHVATSLGVSREHVKYSCIFKSTPDGRENAGCGSDAKGNPCTDVVDAVLKAAGPSFVVVRDEHAVVVGGFISKQVTEDDVEHVRSVGRGDNFIVNFNTGAVHRSASARSGVRVCTAASSPVQGPAIMWGDLDLLLHGALAFPMNSYVRSKRSNV